MYLFAQESFRRQKRVRRDKQVTADYGLTWMDPQIPNPSFHRGRIYVAMFLCHSS